MRYRLAAAVSTTRTPNGGAVLLNTRTGRLYALNPTGAAILTALREGGGDPDRAITALADTHAADRARLADWVHAVVTALRTHGLLDQGTAR